MASQVLLTWLLCELLDIFWTNCLDQRQPVVLEGSKKRSVRFLYFVHLEILVISLSMNVLAYLWLKYSVQQQWQPTCWSYSTLVRTDKVIMKEANVTYISNSYKFINNLRTISQFGVPQNSTCNPKRDLVCSVDKSYNVGRLVHVFRFIPWLVQKLWCLQKLVLGNYIL